MRPKESVTITRIIIPTNYYWCILTIFKIHRNNRPRKFRTILKPIIICIGILVNIGWIYAFPHRVLINVRINAKSFCKIRLITILLPQITSAKIGKIKSRIGNFCSNKGRFLVVLSCFFCCYSINNAYC